MTNRGLFEDDIRPINSKIKDIEMGRAAKAAYRDSQRMQQVVVKVSSYGKSSLGVNAHIDYISRNNKLELEDSSGNVLTSKEEVRELMTDWFSRRESRKNARLTANIVLSAPKGSNRSAVKKAVRNFAKENFSNNYDYLFAMHNDTDHPHAHLSIKLRGYDGTKLRLGKRELHDMRLSFAQSLRDRGISATASYRSDRGVGRKADSQKHRHMRNKDVTPDVDQMAIREAADDLKGLNRKARPWEMAMKANNDKVRGKYREIGKVLESAGDESAIRIGQAITDYADRLPVPVTRHESLKTAITDRAVISREQEQEQGIDR